MDGENNGKPNPIEMDDLGGKFLQFLETPIYRAMDLHRFGTDAYPTKATEVRAPQQTSAVKKKNATVIRRKSRQEKNGKK